MRAIFNVVAAGALAAALVTSCSSGPEAAEEYKRESYFEVVGWFETPDKGLADLTYVDGHLWVADEEGAGLIYKVDPANGSILSFVGTTYGPPSAICSDGTYLYVASRDTGDVWRHRITPRMEELATFPTGLADIRAMFYEDGTFYVLDAGTRAVYEYDDGWNRGSIRRVGTGEESIRGMTRAGGRTWSADWRDGWLNRHRTSNFDVDRKFCTPGWHPAGLAWDGTYLFLGDTGARRIYKLDISTAP
ncbi:MAG: hypothetical protein PVH29_09295 [Candidatus Zixiibacteriota bacterium]|jgi:DNA-binding beta-propeller fold protein YncE